MLSEMGRRVVAIDLDPQANLTSAFLAEDALEALWEPAGAPASGRTIYQCLKPLTEMGDIAAPVTRAVHPRLHLVPGDLSLASMEGLLSQEWGNALGSTANARAFRVLSGFWQVAQMAAAQHRADLVLADVGPSLGAINRSALIATDHVVVPLAADMYSLQGLRNLGPTLRDWRADWQQRAAGWKQPTFALPVGRMQPLGYVLMQHIERLSRPVAAYKKWADRIPATYAESVLQQPFGKAQSADGNCLARLKHYRSLAPMAQEAHKPIFALTSADGAIGGHAAAVRDAYSDFEALARAILERIALSCPLRPMSPTCSEPDR
jgi:cellulose biosynthesis protein BcsQ